MTKAKSIILVALVMALVQGVSAQNDKAKKLDDLITSFAKADQFYGQVVVSENGKAIYDKAFGVCEVKLAAVASRTGSRAEAYRKAAGDRIAKFESFKEPDSIGQLLKSGVDFVCVATPDDRHFSAAKAARIPGIIASSIVPCGSFTLISCNCPNSRISAVRSVTTSTAAIPAAVIRPRVSASSSCNTRSIRPAAPASSRRTGWLCTCSNDSGAARKPSAEAAPEAGGSP